MNRELLQHWQEQGVIVFDTDSDTLWEWGIKLLPDVRTYLMEILHDGQPQRIYRDLVIGLGFDPDTGQVTKKVDQKQDPQPCGNPKCKASTGIHDGLTFGSGELDDNGYWENPCFKCARAFEAANPGEEAWPFKNQKKSKVYTEGDFLNMTLSDLFGYWCLIKLNHIECPSPKDYSEIFEEFTNGLISEICEYLSNERIIKR